MLQFLSNSGCISEPGKLLKIVKKKNNLRSKKNEYAMKKMRGSCKLKKYNGDKLWKEMKKL